LHGCFILHWLLSHRDQTQVHTHSWQGKIPPLPIRCGPIPWRTTTCCRRVPWRALQDEPCARVGSGSCQRPPTTQAATQNITTTWTRRGVKMVKEASRVIRKRNAVTQPERRTPSSSERHPLTSSHKRKMRNLRAHHCVERINSKRWGKNYDRTKP
jgi:hypothetical protein